MPETFVGADFCYEKDGDSTFTGPVLASLGLTTGLTYGDVTRYFGLDDPSGGSGTVYHIEAVAGGSTSCDSALATQDVTVKANTYLTIIGSGDISGNQPLTITPLTDDSDIVVGTSASIRFFDAALGTDASSVDFGEVNGVGNFGTFTALFSNVDYPGASSRSNYVGTNGTVDANGYLSIPQIGATRQTTFAVRDHRGTGTSTNLATLTTALAGGTRHSVFFIGNQANGGPQPLSPTPPISATGYRLINCTDTLAKATQGNVLASCQ